MKSIRQMGASGIGYSTLRISTRMYLETQITAWRTLLHHKLEYSRANFDAHHFRQASREFIYLHLV